jgi:hypothetical protein
MAWTTPKTWYSSELVKEGDLNLHIRDNMNILKTALDSNGKVTALSSTYLANLSGANLTGVVKTAASNTFTAGTQNFNGGSGVRVILPVGTDKW